MLGAALKVIEEVGEEFGKKFGRKYGLFEEYKLDDAEVAIVALGSTAGTTKVVVDELRAKGVKAGLLKPRVFRPFPYKQIAEALKDVKAIAVLDRSDGLAGLGGPVYGEIRSAMYDVEKRPVVIDYVYGLGGRDITLAHISSVYDDLAAIVKNGRASAKLVNYLGVRE
jgi:pyruvate ferredoxin oxidoreductase alpha subunit